MSSLNLRPTVPEDVPGILKLIGEVYAEYDCVLNAEGEEPYLLEPGPYFRSHGGEFWVVEEDGMIRATAAVKLHEDSGELKTLYVHPSLRRQAWGRRLTNLAIDYARAAGKHRMILWSDTRFLDAHRLYRNMGFREMGVRDLKDSNNTVEYGFEMPLVYGESEE
ncbi:MAG: GNAT family N-acetyltransferase [Acidobacteriota bacterium]|nr:GNAT family N-acetyltransferase [Acidobacteriota bacterium]